MILIIKLKDLKNEIYRYDTQEQAVQFFLSEIKSGTDKDNIKIFSANELKLALIEE